MKNSLGYNTCMVSLYWNYEGVIIRQDKEYILKGHSKTNPHKWLYNKYSNYLHLLQKFIEEGASIEEFFPELKSETSLYVILIRQNIKEEDLRKLYSSLEKDYELRISLKDKFSKEKNNVFEEDSNGDFDISHSVCKDAMLAGANIDSDSE